VSIGSRNPGIHAASPTRGRGSHRCAHAGTPRGGLSWRLLLALALVGAGCLTASTSATAAPPAAAWFHPTQRLIPSHIAPGGEALLVDQAINVGDGKSPGQLTFTDALPPHLAVQSVEFSSSSFEEGSVDLGPSGFLGSLELCAVTPERVSCTTKDAAEEEFGSELIPFGFLELRIHVKAEAGAQSGGLNQIEAGGATTPTVRLDRPITVSGSEVGFGAEEFSLVPEEAGGAVDTRGGSHPYQLTNTVTLNRSNSETVEPPAPVRNLQFDLPAGQLGNPRSLPQCTSLQFAHVGEGGNINLCPDSTAIGVAFVTASTLPGQEENFTVPLFNLTPARGEPARFGFEFVSTPVILDTSVRSGMSGGQSEDYGVSVDVSKVTQVANLISATTVFWGSPADISHKESRGWACIQGGRWNENGANGLVCNPSGESNPPAFLTLPADCSAPYAATLGGQSWPVAEMPLGFSFPAFPYSLEDGVGHQLPLTACNQLAFAPKVENRPTSTAPSSPTGLDFNLDFENEGLSRSGALAESEVKKAVVTLPAGVITNPAVANGLSACNRAQYEAEGVESEGCPESSKIGEVEIESPLVEPTIDGSIYVARQHENPADNLLSIYMVAENSELGVLIRSAGAVSPDPRTGQLTTTFGIDGEPLPQLPFSHFHLHFREGPRAPLIAPGLCGRYSTQADLYPWSDPGTPVHREASFQISAPCPATEAQQPNAPTLEAGTVSPIAGAYSPFVFRVKREDGSQILSTISATLPEGLLGKLAGIPFCSAAQIAQAESRSGEGVGALELASPSCPAASQVGTVNVGTGAGPQPYYVQGKAYLAGSYKGAPLSLVIITPAIAGPFDLGTVVVHTALHVDETTAQIHAVSDPLPTILHGLPLVVRSIALNMDRPDFTLNPTSCDPMQVTGAATSTLGNLAPLAQRFQVGACGALGFKPDLKLAYSGQTKRTGHPALKSVITYPKGDYANIARASVTLPKGVLIAQAHVNNPCTRVQFNSTALPGEACPAKSVLGTAKVWTPLLEAPESGKVYFRSNGGERELPDLVIALRGQIPITLVGFIDSVGKKGAEVRRVRTRFQSVPDAPVSRFELQLYGGKRGLLESSQNLCKAKQLSKVQLTAQNGKTYDTEPAVQVSCRKGGKPAKGNGSKKK
jgi:hypothetical protein